MWKPKRTTTSLWKRLDLLALLMISAFIVYLTLDVTLVLHSPVDQQGIGRFGMSEKRKFQTCFKQENVVFIKQMKCATSTLLGTFYRFGYKNNLSFVSPLNNKLYLNWPYKLTMLDFRPSRSGYNILVDHSIYTEDIMEAIMPNDTVYISIIRQPLSHAKSVFKYFKLNIIAGIPANVKNPFITYFNDLNKFEAEYIRPNAKGRACIPNGLSLTKNLMSHCLGMPLGFPPGTQDISSNSEKVDEFFHHIDRKFKLIMLVEYFYESLILLRRLLCWQFNDILFMKSNVAKYSFNEQEIPLNLVDIHKNWTSIDYRLYYYFNTTFWKRVSDQGDTFFDEVSAFKKVEDRVRVYCKSLYALGERPSYRYPKGKEELIIESSKWTSEFTVTPEDCWMLGPNPYVMVKKVQLENDKKEPDLLRKQEHVPDNRELRGLC